MNTIEIQLKREHYIDNVKGIAMLFIIFAHTASFLSVFDEVSSWIYAFHVPIFFLLSGYVFGLSEINKGEINTKEFIKKRIKLLVIPYFIFSFINLMLKIVLQLLTASITKEFITKEIIDFFIIGNGSVWFLFTLFIIECIFIMYKKIKIKNKIFSILISILLMIIPFLGGKYENSFLILFVRIIIGLGYYIFGYEIYWYIDKKCRNKLLNIFMGVFLLIINYFSFIWFNSKFSFYKGYYFNTLGSIICSLSFAVGLLLLFKGIQKNIKFFDYIGKNSLAIMLIHHYFAILFIRLLIYAVDFGKLPKICHVFIGLGYFITVVLITIPCVEIVKNKLPFLIGKKKNSIKTEKL